jgi:uncharacterized protein
VRALVLTGEREFADQWHDLAATSGRLAEILEQAGFGVEVRADVGAALAHGPAVELLAVNCSGAATEAGTRSVLPAEAMAGLSRHVSGGRGLLAVHSAVMSFADWPAWAGLVGARWHEPESMHPPRGPAPVRVCTGAHPIVDGITDFVTDDERYSYLQIAAPFVTLAEHDHDGRAHPLLWARTSGPAGARVVYDGLGHDLVAYDNPTQRELVGRAARWAAGPAPSASL